MKKILSIFIIIFFTCSKGGEIGIPVLPEIVDGIKVGMTKEEIFNLEKNYKDTRIIVSTLSNKWSIMGFPKLPKNIALGDPLYVDATFDFDEEGKLYNFSIYAGDNSRGPIRNIKKLMWLKERCYYQGRLGGECNLDLFEKKLGKGLVVGKTISKDYNSIRYRWTAEDFKKFIHMDVEASLSDSKIIKIDFINY